MVEHTALEISDKLTALDILSGDLDRDFDTAATEVLAGVEGAGKKALSINRRIERLAVDRAILNRALARAQRMETDAEVKAEAERRQRHREAARLNASKLIEQADRVDGLLDTLIVAMGEMSGTWQAVQSSLRAAGEP